MRADKAKVVDEIWDDARIESFLQKDAMGGEPKDFSALLNAYRSMRSSDFVLFIEKYRANGGDVAAKNNAGFSLAEVIAPHEKSAPFLEILSS